MHRVQMDVVFALSFFKQLAGLPVLWEDAKDADPCLYDSCKKILEMDAGLIDTDALGLTFVSEVEELGSHKSMELCSGGKDMVVTSENRRQFVELLVQRRLVASVAEQVKSFSQGFSDLLVNRTHHQQFLRALEPEDLDLMLYGKDRNICLEDWKAHTEYHDFCATDDQIVWFWQVRYIFLVLLHESSNTLFNYFGFVISGAWWERDSQNVLSLRINVLLCTRIPCFAWYSWSSSHACSHACKMDILQPHLNLSSTSFPLFLKF